MKKTVMILAISALSFTAANTYAADGEKLYTEKTCVTCHGANGDKPIQPLYPKIGGQNKEYVLQQLKDFKSGARSNGQSAVMKGILATVSDEEMDAIAQYLSEIK